MNRVSRGLVRALTLLLLLSPIVGRVAATPAALAQEDVPVYTSPQYGWSVAWDDEIWEVMDESSEDAGDLLQLEDPLNTVYFESYEGFDGNALDCVEAEVEELAEQGAESILPGKDADGDEIMGGDTESAYAVYTFSYTVEDDIVIDLVEYNECRRLPHDAVLEISQLTVREAYNDAAPAVQDLLAAVTMPGEEPVDEPESTTGDDGDDPEDDRLSFAQITDISEDVSDQINAYWTNVFAAKDIFYVPPFYEVFDDEATPPCSEEAVHAGIQGPFYCGLNQTIYLDLVLIQPFAEGYGTPAIYYALAHEAGHDVQMQLGITWSGARTVERELEADCMAGAFLATSVEAGDISENEFFILLDLANAIGDPPGITASHENSHGMGSQRIAMLLRGFYNGVDGCGTFEG